MEILLFRKGGSAPFSNWLNKLKDERTVALVRARLNRIRLGNFGDCRSVGGGVHELRIDHGPGLRVYFGRRGHTIVILLCGGNKKSQTRDIVTARAFWKEHLDATKD